MKKLFFVLLAATMTFTLVLDRSAAPAATKPIKLIYECWLPASHAGHQEVTVPFFKGLEAATNGLVTTEYNMAGVMGKPAEQYSRLVSGVTSVSQFGPSYTPGAFPMYSISYNMISAPKLDYFARALIAMYKKGYFDKDFADVKVIGLYGAGPFVLYSSNKEITSVKDMAGLKTRAANDAFVDVIKLLGAAPVTMPAGEVYLATQKGVVDAAWWVVDAIATQKYYEVAKYCCNISMSIFSHVCAMNKNVWNSLPQSGKDYINKNWEKYSTDWVAVTDNKLPAIFKLFQDTPGHKITQLSPAEMANLSKVLSPLWGKWIAETEAKKLPGKKAAQDLDKIFSDLGVKNALVGYTP